MKLNDEQFMEYINKGVSGKELLCVGVEVTTEKILEISENDKGKYIFIAQKMFERARNKEVMTVLRIDYDDNTCCLSDYCWYDIPLITVI